MKIVRDIPWEFDLDAFLADAAIDADGELADEARRLALEAAPRLRPKAVYAALPVERLGGAEGGDGDGRWDVVIGGVTFRSEILRCNLEGVELVYPYVATCGAELEGFDLSPYDYLAFYWLDQIKQRAVGQASAWLHDRVSREAGIARLASMNPGSGNADVWPIEQQRELFALIGEATGEIGVNLTESFLMVPNKTVSGVFFPSETNYMNCKVCTRADCPNRRAPHRSASMAGH